MPPEIDERVVRQAIDAAFEPAAGLTAAFVVTYKGRLIGERYGDGIDPDTSLESWSMGKSVTGTLMGVLIKQGVYNLMQPAPIPEWQAPGDPRSKIRIVDILQMSSGLRIIAPQDPDYDLLAPIQTTSFCIPGASIRLSMLRRDPCSGPRGLSVATTTPIQC